MKTCLGFFSCLCTQCPALSSHFCCISTPCTCRLFVLEIGKPTEKGKRANGQDHVIPYHNVYVIDPIISCSTRLLCWAVPNARFGSYGWREMFWEMPSDTSVLDAGFKLLESIPDFWIKCPSPVLMLRRSFSTKCCQHFNFSLSLGLLMLTHPLNVSLNNYTVTFQRYFMVCVKFQNIYPRECGGSERVQREHDNEKTLHFKRSTFASSMLSSA